MKYERLWKRLIESLDDWTSATEARSGQIEVALPHSGIPARRPLIVITPDEWDDMVTVMWRTALPQLKAVVTRVAASLATAVIAPAGLVAATLMFLNVDAAAIVALAWMVGATGGGRPGGPCQGCSSWPSGS